MLSLTIHALVGSSYHRLANMVVLDKHRVDANCRVEIRHRYLLAQP